MKKPGKENCSDFSEAFYGSSTVGERGQIVIPAEARADMGFHPGDKILIFRNPHSKGLMMFKIEGLRAFLDEFAATLTKLEQVRKDETTGYETAVDENGADAIGAEE